MAEWQVSYAAVTEPRWIDTRRQQIHCRVFFDHLNEEVPFVADPSDVEPHGREIFMRCITGEFGPIAEPDPKMLSEMPVVATTSPPNWPDLQSFLSQANTENASRSERGVVIVWTAMIDELLRRLLEANGGHVPGRFFHRARAAGKLNLITDDELKLLNCVGEIRNEVAHDWSVNLDNPNLSDKCSYLYETLVGDGATFPPRLQFTSA